MLRSESRATFPRWLVILVVSRDFMIVGAVHHLVDSRQPRADEPLMVSKLNTVAQVAFAALVLASLGFQFMRRPTRSFSQAS